MLELSKLHMYHETQNLHSDLKKYFSHIMEFSNFPEDHLLHSLSHQSTLGFLKFEEIEPVRAFIGLKAKMCCFLTEKM